MLRRLFIAFAVLACGLALGCAGIWMALRSPDLAVPRAGELRLEGVTLIEPGVGRCPGCSLVVRGDRIESAGPASPAGQSRDFAGRYVLPGLIDLHVHHPPAFLWGERELYSLLFLAHGVTSVRNTGELMGSVLGLRDRIARGDLPGPRTFVCGPMIDGDPPDWPYARVVQDAESAEALVADLADEGVDCLKIYNNVERNAVKAIRSAAEARGLPVVAHVPLDVQLQFMEGIEVQHLMGMSIDWSEADPIDTAKNVKLSKEHGISHTPTLVAFERARPLGLSEAAQRQTLAHRRAIARNRRSRGLPAEETSDLVKTPEEPLVPQGDPSELLPRYYGELIWDPEKNPFVLQLLPGSTEETLARPANMRTVVAKLHEAGVQILVGTDTLNPFVVPGAAVYEELALLVESGLTVEEAWRSATGAAGKALAVPGLGTLQPGAPADLLVFREDPTRSLDALDSLEAVVAQGRFYDKADLDAAVEQSRERFRSGFYDVVTMATARFIVSRLNR